MMTESTSRLLGRFGRPGAATMLYLAALCVLLMSLAACTRTCPTQLNALDNWYESDELTGFRKITMQATFRNDTAETQTFTAGDSFSLWLRVGEDTPTVFVTIHDEPPASVEPGQSFTYNLTIHTMAYTFKKATICFRGYSKESGTLSPDDMGLVDVVFTCR